MTCREAIDKLYEYLDRELDKASAGKIQKHLDLCRLCCDHFEFEKAMKELIQSSCVQQKASAVLKDKILRALEA